MTMESVGPSKEEALRLLIISHDFKPSTGGEAEFAYALSVAMRERGTHIRILAQPAGEPLSDDVPLSGALERSLALERFASLKSLKGLTSWPAAMWKLYRSISTSIDEHRANLSVVTSHMTWIILALWLKRTPYVLILHGEEAVWLMDRGPVSRLLFLRACATAKWLFFNSEFSRSKVLSIAPQFHCKSEVLGCGVRTETIATQRMGRTRARQALGCGSEPILVTVAKLVERKGIDTVIRAMPSILEQFPTCRYFVVGDGPQRKSLRELSETLGIAANVELLGRVDDLKKNRVYEASDIFLMVSRSDASGAQEGFGISFLEANLNGLPVIGSRCGGIGEAVEDGVNGILVDPLDPSQVSAAVISLLGNPSERKRLAEGGQRRIREKFNWPLIAGKVTRRLADLISKPND